MLTAATYSRPGAFVVRVLSGGAIALGLSACGTTSAQKPTPVSSKVAGVVISERLTVEMPGLPTSRAPLGSVPAATVRHWVQSQPPPGLSAEFIRRYAQRKQDLPLRLVGAAKDHPAIQLIVDRAELLRREGFEQDVTQLAAVVTAREMLANDRLKLSAAKVEIERAKLRAALSRSAGSVELHSWRLAHQLGSLLGGALWPRLSKDFEALILSDTKAALAAVEPDDPAYHALVAGLQKYETLNRGETANVGLGKVRSTIRWLRLKGGKRDARVRRLRERLAAEGFVTNPAKGAENHFDADLVAALVKFQRRNGLPDSGRMNALTFTALKTPVSDRVQQIRVALRDLRKSSARKSSYRLVVNIPAFQLRLLDGGKQVVAHRVVVGNNKRVYDSNSGRTRYGNRTPQLASKVRSLVLNPAWRVPRRIKENELDRRAETRPQVYDDYRFYYDSSGVEWAVQLPGPGNALGRVKFVFSGGNGVFLHDTPKKRDFRKGYRALSHGCVRVQDALGLAKTLLARDNNRIRWGVARSILSSRRETPVQLNRPVAIHLEYRLVGASTDGHLRFYPDIYRRFVKKKRR